MISRAWTILATGLLAVACSSGGDGGPDSVSVVVAAGNQRLAATANTAWAGSVDLSRFGVDSVDAAWDLSTPAGERFSFDLMSRARGNAGMVRVSVGHASDGGLVPLDEVGSIAQAGVTPAASGAVVRGP